MRTVFRDMQRSRAGQRKIHRRASLHGGVSRKSGYTPGSVVGDHLSHSGPRCAPMPAIGVCAPAAGGECVLPAPYGAYLDLHRGGDYPCHRAVAGPLASLSLFTATGHSMRSGCARPDPRGGMGASAPTFIEWRLPSSAHAARAYTLRQLLLVTGPANGAEAPRTSRTAVPGSSSTLTGRGHLPNFRLTNGSG